MGQNSFSQYTFAYLTAIDILSNYPTESEAFLRDIQPVELGHIPSHPLERCLDLYFLNTAEHFTLALSPQTNEELLVAAATPYLVSGGNNHLLEIFEAAHSVMLAVLVAPQSADLTAKHLPFYVDALLKVVLSRMQCKSLLILLRRSFPRIYLLANSVSLSRPFFVSLLLHRLYRKLSLFSLQRCLSSYITAPTMLRQHHWLPLPI